MAHELSIRANGRAEMAYTGNTPWHGLGQSLVPGASIEEWQHAAGMDWEIQRGAVCWTAPDGTTQSWKDREVLYRSDTLAPLGVVSDSYREVQPAATLEFFRDLTAENGFTLETAGMLHGGRRFWALARVGADTAILDHDDKVGSFLLLSTSADGSLSTEGRFTTVRVVCNNTLGLARALKAQVRVTHRSAFCGDAMKHSLGVKPGEVRAKVEEAMDTFRRLASTRVAQSEMVRMTLQAFGHDPDAMGAKELQAVSANKAVSAVGHMAITGAGLRGAGLRGGQGTAWGWLNAVTQYVDHQAPSRTQSNRLDSAWFGRGDSLKTKALEVAIVSAGNRGVASYVATTDDGADGDLMSRVLQATAA